MTQPAPKTRRKSPLRGLAAGLVVALILFRPGWHLIVTSLQWAIGMVIGAVIGVFVHAMLTSRRY
jgi:hypothetical protein